MFGKAFLTGSRAYGEPDASSDIDLVVWVSESTLQELINQADRRLQVDNQYEGEGITVSLRFGMLNLLCCTEEKTYQIWRNGTKKLKRLAPVSRKYAIEFMRKFRQENSQ